MSDAVLVREPSSVLFVVEARHDGDPDDPLLAAEHIDAIVRALDARARGYGVLVGVRPDARATAEPGPSRAGSSRRSTIRRPATIEAPRRCRSSTTRMRAAPRPRRDRCRASPSCTGAHGDPPRRAPGRRPRRVRAAECPAAVTSRVHARSALGRVRRLPGRAPWRRRFRRSSRCSSWRRVPACAAPGRRRSPGTRPRSWSPPRATPQARASIYARLGEVKRAQGKPREAELNFEKALGADAEAPRRARRAGRSRRRWPRSPGARSSGGASGWPPSRAPTSAWPSSWRSRGSTPTSCTTRARRPRRSRRRTRSTRAIGWSSSRCARPTRSCTAGLASSRSSPSSRTSTEDAAERGALRFAAADVALGRIRDEERGLGLLDRALDDDPRHDKALHALVAVRTEPWRVGRARRRVHASGRPVRPPRRRRARVGRVPEARRAPQGQDAQRARRDRGLHGGGQLQAGGRRLARHAGRHAPRARRRGAGRGRVRADRAVRAHAGEHLRAPLRAPPAGGAHRSRVARRDRPRGARARRTWTSSSWSISSASTDRSARRARSTTSAGTSCCARPARTTSSPTSCAPSWTRPRRSTSRSCETRRSSSPSTPARRQSATSTVSVVRSFQWAAQVLSVDVPELYVMDNVPGGIAAAQVAVPIDGARTRRSSRAQREGPGLPRGTAPHLLPARALRPGPLPDDERALGALPRGGEAHHARATRAAAPGRRGGAQTQAFGAPPAGGRAEAARRRR